MTATSKEPLIEARGLHKYFSGIHALNDVSVCFYPGEIVAVMGENGAGKSTLMKVIGGVHQPEEGQLFFEGKPITIDGVNTATKLGISFIHQELNLSDNLSIGANIFLGREPLKNHFLKMIDHQLIFDESKKLLETLKLKVSPDIRVSDLTIGQQQMVEIAKALSQDAKIIIMDEPTSSLTQFETDILLGISKELRDEGVCVVYISHRMKEVQAIADRVLVLRDGGYRGELIGDAIDHDKIVSLMVGREQNDFYTHDSHVKEELLLEVKDLVVPGKHAHPISFTLKKGEILGFAGLVGSGRTEMVETLFGLTPRVSGDVMLSGKKVTINSALQAIEAGFGLVPEDRKQHGLILDDEVKNNVALAGLERYQKSKMVNQDQVADVAHTAVKQFNVKTDTIEREVGMLSGGNQQKVALSKWTTLEPQVLILDEPTRGVDVMSKSDIYSIMNDIASTGVGIIMVSSDLEEVLHISDRVSVMFEGKLMGTLNRDELSEEAVMNLATGKTHE